MRNIGEPHIAEQGGGSAQPDSCPVPKLVSPLREVLKNMEEDRRIREFSFDYCFLGDENGAKITVLVGRERVTGNDHVHRCAC